MLIDDVTIRAKAGRGGDGIVAFNKNMMMLGPTGGSGGNGGSVFLEGVSDIGALRKFRAKKELLAQDGRQGRGQFRDGERGEDIVSQVPIGTVINNLETGQTNEITKIGERICVARGGKGGKGNFHFRSSRNTTPKIFEPGKEGEAVRLRFELKLIADIGLIGLPNAGKSSLLNALTNASAKVANYPFTTLEPNLGVWNELIIADIPGLIEGASMGKGLGVKFLRHMERTSVIFHLVSAEAKNPYKDYKVVRDELGAYNKKLLEKREFVFLSKADMLSEAELNTTIISLEREILRVYPLSIIDDTAMKMILRVLGDVTDEKRMPAANA